MHSWHLHCHLHELDLRSHLILAVVITDIDADFATLAVMGWRLIELIREQKNITQEITTLTYAGRTIDLSLSLAANEVRFCKKVKVEGVNLTEEPGGRPQP